MSRNSCYERKVDYGSKDNCHNDRAYLLRSFYRIIHENALSKNRMQRNLRNLPSTEQDVLNNIRLEYFLIQNKIDNYGSTGYKIKGFAITLFLAVAGFSVKEDDFIMPLVGIPILLVFAYYEGVNLIHYKLLKRRALIIEKALSYNKIWKTVENPKLARDLSASGRYKILEPFYQILKNWRESIIYFIISPVLVLLTLIYSFDHLKKLLDTIIQFCGKLISQ